MRIGEEPLVGCDENFQLPRNMLEALRHRGFIYLHQVIDPIKSNIFNQEWVSTGTLGFIDDEENLWENYCHSLKNILTLIEDELGWSRKPIAGGYTQKLGYKAL